MISDKESLVAIHVARSDSGFVLGRSADVV